MKIIPKKISGKYRTIKNLLNYILLIIYLGGSWLMWNRGAAAPDQALIVDLPGRKAYAFGLTILPDQMYIMTALLIIAALALFLVTSVFGRLWCGFSCPHTVYTDLFRKVELFVIGDYLAQEKFYQSPNSKQKLFKLLIIKALWTLIAFSFAFGWVCYFYGSHELVADIANFSVSKNGMIWLFSLTASTYFFAGHFQHRVCTYICPYGRFQSAMVDEHTLQVHYNDWRGEPRGSLKSGAKGDCIDCFQCVYVCPMGIDIRNGWQMECIGCGLCIDACDQVMDKVDRPHGLIAFESSDTVVAKEKGKEPIMKYITIKNLLFLICIMVTSSVLMWGILHTHNIRYSVIYAGNPTTTILTDGSIRNNLRLYLRNQTEVERDVQLRASIQGAEMKLGSRMEYVNTIILTLNPYEEYTSNFFIKHEDLSDDAESLIITLIDLNDGKRYKANILSVE